MLNLKVNEKEESKTIKKKKRRTEKDVSELDGADYINSIMLAVKSFNNKPETYTDKKINIVPNTKYVKNWDWGKMNENKLQEVTQWIQSNLKEILDDFKDIHFAEALRFLIFGEYAHELIKIFKEKNPKKKDSNAKTTLGNEKKREQKEEDEIKMLQYLKKHMPLQVQCMGKDFV